MANRYQYSAPYSGQRVAPLPPGYMEAATEPGRNLAAGIASFGRDIGDAIKQHKEDAKAADGLRKLIGIYRPDKADEAKTWSKSEAEGFIRGEVLKADESERASIQSLRGAQTGQLEAGRAEIERQAANAARFNQLVANPQPDPVATAAGGLADPRSGVTLSSLGQFTSRNPVVSQLTPEMVMRYAAESGSLTPEMAGDLSQFAAGPQGFTTGDMGVARPVSGIPNRFFVPTSKSGGQLVDSVAQASGDWQEQFLPDGSPTGWAIAADGSYRRLRDKRDAVGAEQYDLDGDGIISQEEFQLGVVAEKFGGLYPGQVVGPKKSGAGPSGSPSEAYRAWKSK